MKIVKEKLTILIRCVRKSSGWLVQAFPPDNEVSICVPQRI